MFGLLAWPLVGVVIWMGVTGIPWVWCLAVTPLAIGIYLGVKYEQGVLYRMTETMQGAGFLGTFAWLFLSQLATVSIFYGIGYLFS